MVEIDNQVVIDTVVLVEPKLVIPVLIGSIGRKDFRDERKTFLLGETLPAYNTFQMYFISHYHVGSNNSPPNFHLVHPYCYSKTIRITEPVVCPGHTASFQGDHPGGVTMAMADGAVAFIPEHIDYHTWCVLGDRDSNTPVNLGAL